MIEKPEMLILSGLPASGKSTLAKAWVAEDPDARIRINWDDMRLARYGPDWTFNRPEEDSMQAASFTTVHDAISAGISVVIDNTNLTPKARNRWASFGQELGATIVYQELDTPVQECVRRDQLRTGCARVGRAVIENMALRNGFFDWDDYEGQFVIVDVDGTLADCSHRQDYVVKCCRTKGCKANGFTNAADGKCPHCSMRYSKNWGAFFRECHLDEPITPVIKLVRILSERYNVIVVSGRPMDACGRATEGWLDEHLDSYEVLFMRQGGDKRPDTDVKQEILDYLPKDRVAYVIDDRPSVLRMWQSNGLTTLAVGDLKEF